MMLAPGTVLFDKYRVDRVLGRGGMAVVYAATHRRLGEAVAIKVLHRELAGNTVAVQRFLQEAQTAARLKGEHVMRVLDVGTLPDGAPYLLMEYLEGSDLERLLAAGARLAPSEAVDFILQACEALAEAHATGIVHRDVKPSNFFITRRPDGSPLLKLLDFGVSKIIVDEVSKLTQNAILGTPAYMAPEQLRGSRDIDARADIWSLGVVLYEVLSGRQPFVGETYAALVLQAATEPTPQLCVELPHGLDAIVYRCLEKDRTRRFQSIAELSRALASYAGDQRAAAMTVSRTDAILQWSPPSAALTGVPITSANPTTLNASAGALVTRERSSRIGWVVGGGVMAGIVASLLVWTGMQRSRGEPASVGDVRAIDQRAAPVTVSPPPEPPPAEPPPAEPPPAEPPASTAPETTESVAAPTLEPDTDQPAEDVVLEHAKAKPSRERSRRIRSKSTKSTKSSKDDGATSEPPSKPEPPPAPEPDPLELRM